MTVGDSDAVSFSKISVTNLGVIAVKLRFGECARSRSGGLPGWVLKDPTTPTTYSEVVLKGEAKSLQLG